MSSIYISGVGAVSPAGWSVPPFRDALAKGLLLPSQNLTRPGQDSPLRVMRVPPPNPRPAFFTHPRLRRTSPIAQFALSAAIEALGSAPATNLGVIVCVLSGCINYSRRFYDEALKDPATASPLVFPETVFNAPASHISAFLGTKSINYSLVGDAGTFLVGLATAAQWILERRVEHCLVIGTEEVDWLSSDALRLFDRSKLLSEGAGAVRLSHDPRGALARLQAISDEFLYGSRSSPLNALRAVRDQLVPQADSLLCDSTSSDTGISRDEVEAWRDWKGPRLSPKRVLGESLMASAAWQAVAAADALGRNEVSQAVVSVAGFHQHAVGALFGPV